MKNSKAQRQTEIFQPKVASKCDWGREWPLWVKVTLLLAFVLRVAFLQWKSPHFDEAINGHFVNQIWANGFFQYDPSNFHGPLYFYLLHFSELLFGRGIFAFRFVTALLSTAVVALTLMHARYLGRAAYVAGVIIAVSPAMVFYGRYAIHETLLILGQLLFSYGFLRWRFEGGRSAVFLMVAGTVVAAATKETFFIFLGTWLIAWTMVRFGQKVAPAALRFKESWPTAKPVGGKSVWLWSIGFGAIALCALFSGFFVFPRGIHDMVAAFAFWTKTGTGATGHEKPFIYWLEILAKYEWPILLALIVSPVAVLFGSLWTRVFTLTGFGLWLAYSIIPYKTPWCVMGFIWPLAFGLGGLSSDELERVRNLRFRQFARFAAAALVVVSMFTAVRISFRDFEKIGEPYVYVQTTQDVNIVTRTLENRVRLNPEDRGMRIQVFSQDPWPLPWLLSLYPRTEFAKADSASSVDGAVILVDQADSDAVEKRLSEKYLRRTFQIRDSYGQGFAYFQEARFRDFIPEPFTLVEGTGGQAQTQATPEKAPTEGSK